MFRLGLGVRTAPARPVLFAGASLREGFAVAAASAARASAAGASAARAAAAGARPASTMRQEFTMDQAGLAMDLYVPPRRLPSWFTQPALRWKALKRRVQTTGLNTWMAIRLRREVGRHKFQPLEWKETALLLYARMNECFVRRDLAGLQRVCSRWVYAPLAARVQKLPRDYAFDWKLVRYTRRPKIVSLIPLSMDNESTRYVQATYRIDSIQVLSKTKLGTDKVERVEREVSDNIAFIFDMSKSPVEGRLIGSLFETPPSSPMPDLLASPPSRPQIMEAMTLRGDVFRNPPEYVAVKEPMV